MGMQMTDLAEHLGVLMGELGNLGSAIGGHLRPGRTVEEIRVALRALDLDPPAELADWYAWHDATDDPRTAENTSPIEVFPGVTALRLDETAGLCREMRETYHAAFGDGAARSGDGTMWRDDWFPILVGLGIFAVECRGGKSNDTAPVWRFLSHPSQPGTRIVASSLAAFVYLLVAEIRAGSVWWDSSSQSIQPRVGDEERLDRLGLV